MRLGAELIEDGNDGFCFELYCSRMGNVFVPHGLCDCEGRVCEYWIRLGLLRLGHDLVGFVGLGIYSFLLIRPFSGHRCEVRADFLLFAVRLKLFLFSYGLTFYHHWPELRVYSLHLSYRSRRFGRVEMKNETEEASAWTILIAMNHRGGGGQQRKRNSVEQRYAFP